MHLNSLLPIVQADVRFGRSDIHALMNLSANHYDGRCKAAGGYGGFLYGWSNLLGNNAFVDITVEWSDLDMLAKIAEGENDYQMLGGIPVRGVMGEKLHNIMQKMHERVNVLSAYSEGLDACSL